MNGITKLQLAVAMGITATSAMFTSCVRDFDYYDPDRIKQEYEYSWQNTFGTIDSEQDWSMASKVQVNYTVYLDGLETYKLQIFTTNPLVDENTTLLANYEVTTDDKGYATKSFAMDIDKGSTAFYACYEDKYGNRYVKSVGLIDGQINVTFGGDWTAAAPKRAAKRASGIIMDVSYDEVYEKTMAKASQAVEVSDANCSQNSADNPNYAAVMKVSAGNTWTKNISVLGSTGEWARTVYVYGTLVISEDNKLGSGGSIVVCEGGTLEIKGGATLTTHGDGGTNNPGNIIVLHGGKIEGEGSLTLSNGTGTSYSYVASGATVTIGSLNNNGGLFYNYGELTVGTLYGGAVKSEYVNNGKMRITSTSGSANTRIYNNCYLTSDADLSCMIIEMGETSYLGVGGNLTLSSSWDGTSDPSQIDMAANSYIHVNGNLSVNSTNIVGPTEGYAVFECNNVSYANYDNDGTYVTKGYVINNIYFSVANPTYGSNVWNPSPYEKLEWVLIGGKVYEVKQTESTKENNWQSTPYRVYKTDKDLGNGNTVIVETGKAILEIPASECTPGYGGNQVIPETPNVYDEQTYIFACEDLGGTDDYDFNDVVFSVSHVAGSTTATVKALAAGGTYATTIYYKEAGAADSTIIGEIHALLGGPTQLTSVMLNTNQYPSENKYVHSGTILTVPTDWSIADCRTNFILSINTGTVLNGQYLTQNISAAKEAGKAPQVIVLPADWRWPIERVNMIDAFPDFGNWTSNSNDYSWLSNKVEDKLVKLAGEE